MHVTNQMDMHYYTTLSPFFCYPPLREKAQPRQDLNFRIVSENLQQVSMDTAILNLVLPERTWFNFNLSVAATVVKIVSLFL